MLHSLPLPVSSERKGLTLGASLIPSIFRTVTPSRLSTNREARARGLVAREHQALGACAPARAEGVVLGCEPPCRSHYSSSRTRFFHAVLGAEATMIEQDEVTQHLGRRHAKRKMDREMLGMRTRRRGRRKAVEGPDPSPVCCSSPCSCQCSCVLAPCAEPHRTLDLVLWPMPR